MNTQFDVLGLHMSGMLNDQRDKERTETERQTHPEKETERYQTISKF